MKREILSNIRLTFVRGPDGAGRVPRLLEWAARLGRHAGPGWANLPTPSTRV
jgi:hypothetical protein